MRHPVRWQQTNDITIFSNQIIHSARFSPPKTFRRHGRRRFHRLHYAVDRRENDEHSRCACVLMYFASANRRSHFRDIDVTEFTVDTMIDDRRSNGRRTRARTFCLNRLDLVHAICLHVCSCNHVAVDRKVRYGEIAR